jgi:hypothetical protein
MDANSASIPRVLVVADWAADPYSVIAACRRRAADDNATLALVVPALLHGIDWIGDPNASRPCAARQLAALTDLARRAGIRFALVDVGDPDPTSAVDDAIAEFAATEILLCHGEARRSHPLDLAHRLQRATGMRVETSSPGRRRAPRGRYRRHGVLAGGHCAAEAA